VKEWFSKTSFMELDTQLRELGNNRHAIVFSDLALHVPGLDEPVFFHGETSGVVAQTPPADYENPRYPWLTTKTFNGWFVPYGAGKTLAELSYEESWHFDFRIKALRELCQRLKEYKAIINATPQRAYRRVRRAPPLSGPRLFEETSSSFLVIGYSSVGKTRFGQYVSSKFLWPVIEASDALREGFFFPANIEVPENPFAYAKLVLHHYGANAVARYILDAVLTEYEDEPFIVTGFRTIEEVLTIKEAVPDVKLVWLYASPRERFQRHLRRARDDLVKDFRSFVSRDEAQRSFGLLDVGEQLADIIVHNTYELEHYKAQIEWLVNPQSRATPPAGVQYQFMHHSDLEHGQLYKCLAALELAGRPLTTEEIGLLTPRFGLQVRHNNANKVLKAHPALADRLEGGGERLRYRITSSGHAYLRLARLKTELDSDAQG
jgi:dephospho-CoA kinase